MCDRFKNESSSTTHSFGLPVSMFPSICCYNNGHGHEVFSQPQKTVLWKVFQSHNKIKRWDFLAHLNMSLFPRADLLSWTVSMIWTLKLLTDSYQQDNFKTPDIWIFSKSTCVIRFAASWQPDCRRQTFKQCRERHRYQESEKANPGDDTDHLPSE